MAAVVVALFLVSFGGVAGFFSCDEGPSPILVVDRSELGEGGEVEEVAGDEWRLVQDGDRLEVEELRDYGAPVEEVPLRREVSPRVREALRIAGEMPSKPVVREVEVEIDGLECNDAYRELLRGYSVDGFFSARVAEGIAETLLERRDDCGAEGWSPVFKLGRVCTQSSVGGVRLPNSLLRYEGSLNVPRSVGTVMDPEGNILVHFEKLPLSEGRGCWFYEARSRRWAWFTEGVGRGVDGAKFPRCEARLRQLVVDGVQSGAVDSLRVARWVDEVRLGDVGGCPEEFWNPYAGSGGHQDCGEGWSTGVIPDGRIVVNWQEGFRVSSGAVCWVLSPGGAEWEEYFDSR